MKTKMLNAESVGQRDAYRHRRARNELLDGRIYLDDNPFGGKPLKLGQII